MTLLLAKLPSRICLSVAKPRRVISTSAPFAPQLRIAAARQDFHNRAYPTGSSAAIGPKLAFVTTTRPLSTATKMAEKPTILLIHGLWMTPLAWEEWIAYYESKGYKVIAPGWPGIDGRTPAEIRADPKPMADKSIENIVDSYEAIIKSLPAPPIIMGHSFGGLFTQILLSRGLGAVGVGIAPAQPAGIFALPFSTIKAGFPVLSNPFDYASTVKISASEFHYCFGNHTTQEESDKLWEKYSVPSVAHVLWQGALALLHPKTAASHVEFEYKCRAPLLLIAGAKDHVVPASVVKKEYETYSHAEGQPVVDYKLFEGRSHGIVNQEGWKEVADYALAFVEKNLAAKSA